MQSEYELESLSKAVLRHALHGEAVNATAAMNKGSKEMRRQRKREE